MEGAGLNASATETDGASLRPAGGTAAAGDPMIDEESGLWILPDPDDGVALTQFLDRAKPSLAEAAALAAAVLEAVGARHAGGRSHGELDSRAVRVALDGSARITGACVDLRGPDGPPADARRADVRATAAIAKAAGRPARPLTGAEERLVARLSSAADARRLVRRSPLRAAHGLQLAIGPADRRRMTEERLVGLIRAVAAADAPLGSAGFSDGRLSGDAPAVIDGV